MAVLGWLGMVGVLVAWAVCEVWERVTSTEVLQVFEDAEHPPEVPHSDEVAAAQQARIELALSTLEPVSDAEIERLLSGDWTTGEAS